MYSQTLYRIIHICLRVSFKCKYLNNVCVYAEIYILCADFIGAWKNMLNPGMNWLLSKDDYASVLSSWPQNSSSHYYYILSDFYWKISTWKFAFSYLFNVNQGSATFFKSSAKFIFSGLSVCHVNITFLMTPHQNSVIF